MKTKRRERMRERGKQTDRYVDRAREREINQNNEKSIISTVTIITDVHNSNIITPNHSVHALIAPKTNITLTFSR